MIFSIQQVEHASFLPPLSSLSLHFSLLSWDGGVSVDSTTSWSQCAKAKSGSFFRTKAFELTVRSWSITSAFCLLLSSLAVRALEEPQVILLFARVSCTASQNRDESSRARNPRFLRQRKLTIAEHEKIQRELTEYIGWANRNKDRLYTLEKRMSDSEGRKNCSHNLGTKTLELVSSAAEA